MNQILFLASLEKRVYLKDNVWDWRTPIVKETANSLYNILSFFKGTSDLKSLKLFVSYSRLLLYLCNLDVYAKVFSGIKIQNFIQFYQEILLSIEQKSFFEQEQKFQTCVELL